MLKRVKRKTVMLLQRIDNVCICECLSFVVNDHIKIIQFISKNGETAE